MIEEDKEITRLMHADIEGIEAPRSKFLDVDQAMRTGRRQRWYGPTAGAAVLVAALAVGVAVVPGQLRNEPARNGGTNMVAAGGYTVLAAESSGLASLPQAPAAIDPMGLYLRFGWLPDGYDHRQYQAGFVPGRTGSVAYLSADQDRDANSPGGTSRSPSIRVGSPRMRRSGTTVVAAPNSTPRPPSRSTTTPRRGSSTATARGRRPSCAGGTPPTAGPNSGSWARTRAWTSRPPHTRSPVRWS